MKKLVPFLLAALCAFALTGCKKEESMSTMEKIQNTLNHMESYTATATLTRISNKGENSYETKQSYKSTGEYKLELTAPENVAGNYTVFDGKTIGQYNKKAGGKITMEVPESQQRNELFLGAFVKNYMQSENVSIAVSNMEEGKCTVLEAVIPGGNQYLSTEKLWIDNETLKPVQLIIYDKDNNERYVVTYHEFQYNVTFDENYFKLPE